MKLLDVLSIVCKEYSRIVRGAEPRECFSKVKLTKDRYRFLHGEPWIQNGECVFKATHYNGKVVVWVLMGKRVDDIAYLNIKTVEGLRDGDFEALYKIAKKMV